MAPIDEVEHFFRSLVDVLSKSEPDRLRQPIQVSEIYKSILPYRHYRSALGFDTNEDYEIALLRFLGGEGGFASVDPPEVQDALAEEARAVNPNPGAFREFAAANVFLNAGAVRTVTDAHAAYAPPARKEVEDQADEFALENDEGLLADGTIDEEAPIRGPISVVEPVPGGEELVGVDTADEDVAALPECCESCGKDLPVGRQVNFCPYCGHDKRIVLCPNCGTDLEAEWRYCVVCGHALGDR